MSSPLETAALHLGTPPWTLGRDGASGRGVSGRSEWGAFLQQKTAGGWVWPDGPGVFSLEAQRTRRDARWLQKPQSPELRACHSAAGEERGGGAAGGEPRPRRRLAGAV